MLQVALASTVLTLPCVDPLVVAVPVEVVDALDALVDALDAVDAPVPASIMFASLPIGTAPSLHASSAIDRIDERLQQTLNSEVMGSSLVMD
jgi:hypothetical protein